MALRQLLNRSCNSPDVVFRTIRDFLAAQNGIDDFSAGGGNPGPGYEIVDASYASGDPSNTTTNDWCVLRSHGEAGSYPVFIRLNFGATQHGINPYLGWNPETHAGFATTARTTNIYHNGAGEVLLWIYADLDEIHIVIRPQNSTNYYWHPCGRLKPDMTVYDGAAVQVADAVPAGQNTVVALPSRPAWMEVGKRLYAWDTQGMQEVEIAAVDANTITLATSPARAAGSWLAEDLFLYAVTAHNSTAGNNDTLYGLPTRAGSVAAAKYTPILPAISGSDGKYGDRFGSDIWIQTTGEVRGRLGLARVSRAAASAQGQAWLDEAGRNWRLHTVQSGVVMAFREAN